VVFPCLAQLPPGSRVVLALEGSSLLAALRECWYNQLLAIPTEPQHEEEAVVSSRPHLLLRVQNLRGEAVCTSAPRSEPQQRLLVGQRIVCAAAIEETTRALAPLYRLGPWGPHATALSLYEPLGLVIAYAAVLSGADLLLLDSTPDPFGAMAAAGTRTASIHPERLATYIHADPPPPWPYALRWVLTDAEIEADLALEFEALYGPRLLPAWLPSGWFLSRREVIEAGGAAIEEGDSWVN
jgi:hypothetical protein